jgi:histidinol-phosphatase (PHP family)
MNNYHTHTWRCRHADGDVADYVEAARAAGIDELGFSDHVPYPDGRWSWVRMSMDELPGYLAAVEAAREGEEGRADGLSIRLGLECEYSRDLASYLGEELLGRRGLDYLAAGIHSYEFEGGFRDSFEIGDARGLRAYARQVEAAARSGLFAFLAHPDIFANAYLAWDPDAEACARDILAACAAVGLPLEINGHGLRKPFVRAPEGRRPPYPHRGFWELAADYEVDVIVNSDAHYPADIARGLAEGRALAAGFGLKLLEALPLPALA